MPELVRPYPQLPFNPPASTLAAVLFGVTIVAALYFGREVLVPIALAILLSFILAPLVRSSFRGSNRPSGRNDTGGLRVCRTLP